MFNHRFKAAAIALAASAGLSACTSLGPYGGTNVGVSYGNGYGYGSPYGYGYGSPYGYGYGSPYGYANPYGGYPYYGWYDGYYYPGTGYWVYDPNGGRHPITTKQKNYWAAMLEKVRAARQAEGAQATTAVKENWSGFGQRAKVRSPIGVNAEAGSQAEQGSLRQARRQARIERQQAQVEGQQQARAERQQVRSSRPLHRRMEERRNQTADE